MLGVPELIIMILIKLLQLCFFLLEVFTYMLEYTLKVLWWVLKTSWAGYNLALGKQMQVVPIKNQTKIPLEAKVTNGRTARITAR